jgi:hypothetical protein
VNRRRWGRWQGTARAGRAATPAAGPPTCRAAPRLRCVPPLRVLVVEELRPGIGARDAHGWAQLVVDGFERIDSRRIVQRPNVEPIGQVVDRVD